MDETQAGSQETKEAKFVRLATKRTQAALEKIKLISNLASPGYRYTDEQAAQILTSLRQAVDAVEGKFNKVKGAGASGPSFSL